MAKKKNKMNECLHRELSRPRNISICELAGTKGLVKTARCTGAEGILAHLVKDEFASRALCCSISSVIDLLWISALLSCGRGGKRLGLLKSFLVPTLVCVCQANNSRCYIVSSVRY